MPQGLTGCQYSTVFSAENRPMDTRRVAIIDSLEADDYLIMVRYKVCYNGETCQRTVTVAPSDTIESVRHDILLNSGLEIGSPGNRDDVVVVLVNGDSSQCLSADPHVEFLRDAADYDSLLESAFLYVAGPEEGGGEEEGLLEHIPTIPGSDPDAIDDA